MSKEIKNKIVPKLRFREFVNDADWEEKTLDEIANVVASGDLDSKSFSSSPTKTHVYPVYSNSISNEGLYGYNTSFKYKPGSITITARGTLGVAFVRNTEFVGIGRLLVVSDLKDINPVFLKENWNNYALVPIENGGIPQLTAVKAKSVSLLYPHINEQQKIADCLFSLDELISAENRKLEALKAHKKGLMQQLFPAEGKTVPKLRFKEFRDSGEWEEILLGSVIEIKGRIGYRGYTIEDIVSKGEGAVTLSPSNFDGQGSLFFEKCTYISWDKYYESPEIMLEDGYTVLVKTGSSYGKAALVKALPEKTTINPQIVVLKPLKVDPIFLFLTVVHPSVQKQIDDTVVGGAIPTLSQDSISKFKVFIPKIQEQQNISSCFLSLEESMIAQTKKIDALKTHKKGLMQQLFPNTN